MSELEDDLDDDCPVQGTPVVKSSLSRLKKASVRTSAQRSSAEDGQQLDNATKCSSSQDSEDAACDFARDIPEGKTAAATYDDDAIEAAASDRDDAQSSESDCARDSGDEYWDEEDELADDLQRDIKSASHPASSYISGADDDPEIEQHASDSGQGRNRRTGAKGQQAKLNKETQRLLRESAAADRIGKGAQMEAPSDMRSTILAKLLAQRKEIIARKPVLPRQEESDSSSEDDAESEDGDGDEEMDLDFISDDENLQPGCCPLPSAPGSAAPALRDAPRFDSSRAGPILGNAPLFESAKGGSSTAAAAAVAVTGEEGAGGAPEEETLELELVSLPPFQDDCCGEAAAPSLHLMLDSQTLDSQCLDDVEDLQQQGVPATGSPQQEEPSGMVASSAVANSAKPALLRQQAQPQQTHANTPGDQRDQQSATGAMANKTAPAERTMPAVLVASDADAAAEESDLAEGSETESERESDDEKATLNASVAGLDSGGCHEDEGHRAICDDGASQHSDSSSSDSDRDDESDAEAEDAPPADRVHADKMATDTGTASARRERSNATAKATEAPRVRNPFLEMEAEMSDDEGHSDDGSASDVDDDGELADLIGEGREGLKDSKKRQKLHATWAQQRDEAEMAGVVAAMRSGWKRSRHHGPNGEEEGNDRDTRRRRAALVGGHDDEEHVVATAFDAAELFGSRFAPLAAEDQEPCSDEEIAANEEEQRRTLKMQRFLDISQSLEPEPMMDGIESRALQLLADRAKQAAIISAAAAAAAATAAAASRPAHGMFGSDLTRVTGASFLGRAPAGNQSRHRDFRSGGGSASRSFIFGSRDDSNSGRPPPPSTSEQEAPSEDLPVRPTSFSGMLLGKPQRTAAAARKLLGKPQLLGRLNRSSGSGLSSKAALSSGSDVPVTKGPRQILGVLKMTECFGRI